MTVMIARHISVGVERPVAEVYAFLAEPRNFPKWAEGLGHSFEPIDDWNWRAVTPMGVMNIRFTPRNSFGVADHSVIPDGGEPMFNPLRVVANGPGSEVVFTLYRRAGMTDDQFEGDAAWVAKDLAKLKALLETS